MFRRRQLLGAVQAFADLAALGGAFTVAFLVRFEGAVPAEYAAVLRFWLPIVLAVQVLCLAAAGVRRLTWRYVSLFEARRIAAALAAATTLLLAWRLVSPGLMARWPALEHGKVPLSIVLLDLVFSLVFLVSLRLAIRLWHEDADRRRRTGRKAAVPTLLVGAGQRGAGIAQEVLARPDLGVRPVGFLDDDPHRWGTLIHGVPVLGRTNELAAFAARHGVRQVLITLASTSDPAVLRIARACDACRLPVKIIPELADLVGGRVNLLGMRALSVEDLLPRAPVDMDTERVSGVLSGRTVVITGAGGSIGAELCREVCRFRPRALVLVEQAENSLFQIHRELCQSFPAARLVPCIADICDVARMEQIFRTYRPDVVLHAAAHKHVPMMEWNPGEAIKNNVLGTRGLADLADRHGVGHFVMISTDKAVNPTSVMGVSKRVAELYIQGLSQRSPTRFVTVRFGNVWASAGSVVPIFKEQIAAGGPVTVTHPDMQRYFMTIPEACKLVLQAAALGKGGEIFMLDMGEPVKILELARDLIRLSGLVPERDIQIHFTGIRPGEKLTEELSLEEEGATRTAHPKIFMGRLRPHSWEVVSAQIAELHDLAGAEPARIHAKLKEIVPEYTYAHAPVATPVAADAVPLSPVVNADAAARLGTTVGASPG
jgi:FlaA1/EpsC-like NDP-sugar epimerase